MSGGGGRRVKCNILVTGTPGTGKSSFVELLQDELEGIECINANELVKEKGYHEGRDEELDTLILDEDRLLDDMETKLGQREGGVVVEYHSSELFPERWFDLVVVLRTDNTVLFDRLTARGYSERKREENLQIFGVVAEEARDSYRPDIVWECQNDTVEQMDESVAKVVEFVRRWK